MTNVPDAGEATAVPAKSADRVFVVHGRNSAARDGLFGFLRSLALKPIEWDQAVAWTGKGSPYIGEVLDVAFEVGQAVVVLLTPDDMAYIRREYSSGEDDPELDPAGQARPNVLFEAGMAIGRNPDRTILVELGELRPFSDVAGRHSVRLDNSAGKRKSLAERLKTAGCPVDLSGTDWLTSGDLTPPEKPGKGLPIGKRLPSQARHGAHVTGHWYDRGSGKFAEVKITNNGALPLFDVQVLVPEDTNVQIMQDAPVRRLPSGQTMTVRGDNNSHTFGPSGPSQFDLILRARLEDGTPFEQEVYFDAG